MISPPFIPTPPLFFFMAMVYSEASEENNYKRAVSSATP